MMDLFVLPIYHKDYSDEENSSSDISMFFRVLVRENIICQRYFKINSYNPVSARSYELAQTIRECGERIDTDLKFKTQAYLEIFAPQYFDTEDEMNNYFKNKITRFIRYSLIFVIIWLRKEIFEFI